ncbi:hypothetical protein HOLleu_44205 [Holothuria leucospilota]|uniref:Uncharacterized protein n=1 Tax=Holothuria leucospilota TaxID=206669 RepID=A0A9Q0YG41_HOLLE|nr:hypothetical protein HOLleu_44205 [Holothuria leucospilota]
MFICYTGMKDHIVSPVIVMSPSVTFSSTAMNTPYSSEVLHCATPEDIVRAHRSVSHFGLSQRK